MKHARIGKGHSTLLLLFSLGLCGGAWAQDGKPIIPPGIDKTRLPGLKPGAVPPKLPIRTPPKLGPLAQKKEEDDKKKSTADRFKRRTPPGSTKDDSKDVPRWRQGDEADEPEQPTLSADFLKNCARLRPGVKVHLDIYDEELEAVVKLIACMTGKNIILPKPLKGKKITIYSPAMVTSNEAYRAFLTALEANDLTIVQKGRFLEIIDTKQYKSQPGPITTGDGMPPNEDRMVTQIVRVKNVDAQEMSELLSQFASPHANFVVYQPTNSLIVTELGSNLRKLIKLLRELDIPGGQEQLWTYQVLHAEAGEIASKITEIFDQEGGAKATGGRAPARPAARGKTAAKKSGPDSSAVGDSAVDVKVSKVIADERTNRLLIMATAKSYRRVKNLIQRLDVAIPGDGQVHIHQLNHAKAADLASVLSNLSQEQQNRGNQRRAGNQRRPARATGGANAAAGGGGATSAALFEGEVSVTADEDTNALVITSSLKDYLSLKKVIDILDRPRRQVFIEAVIMEVSITNNRNVGISMHGGIPGVTIAGEDVPVVLSSQTLPGATSLDITSGAALQGLAVGAASESTTTIGGLELPSFGVILNAIARSSDVNILSAPHILTTDNEEAEIVVGSNVPFVSGIVGGLGAGGGGTGNLGGAGFFPTVNVQRQDVALTLKITPRINAANFVTLEIDQVIEEIEGISQELGPTTSKRSIKSTVVVKDQHSVVIGGLQKNRQVNGKTAVPLLGEIPLIGYLFRNSEKERERRNLLLLLTPHVVEGPADFRAIFERKMEEHREFAERFHKEGDALVLGVDYGKKHGVVEAINKSLSTARDEDRLLEELRRQEAGPPLPQDLDGLDVEPVPPEPLDLEEPNPADEDAP